MSTPDPAVTEVAGRTNRLGRLANLQRRHVLLFLCFASVFICYADRTNMSFTIIPMAKEYGWDKLTQGYVLSSFFVGYLLMQVGGGVLSERFGGKVVLAAGVLSWSLFTALTPPAAMAGLWILMLARVGMGIGEAVTFPAIYSLFGRWMPATERTRAAAFTSSGIPIGSIFTAISTPFIANALGWHWVFYIFGTFGVVWWLFWHRAVTALPQQHPSISASELELIERDVAPTQKQEPAPWGKILRSMPVWAIVVAHFCNNWSGYVLLSWMPTYLTEGLHLDYAAVGWYTMLPSLVTFVMGNVAGNVADRLIRRGIAVGTVRKLCQSLGVLGGATALLFVGQVDTAEAAVLVMTLGALVSSFGSAGFWSNHLDIAPRYAGTLMGISNTAATIPGIIGVQVAGLILQRTGSWIAVFELSAGVLIAGLVFYLAFASGKKLFD